MQQTDTMLPVALTIAGSDSGGCAGIQADLLTFAHCGVRGTTALTCVTAQNPDGVKDIVPLTANFVAAQLAQVAAYYDVKGVKTGIVLRPDIIEAIVDFLVQKSSFQVVVDPVMVASSGALLLEPDAVAALERKLLPRATVMTPNLDEAGVLLEKSIDTPKKMEVAACELAGRYGTAVLLKGGHLPGDSLIDVLVDARGTVLQALSCRRMLRIDTHGSGCTLSAALTAELAKGRALETAVVNAHHYLQQAFRHAITVNGKRFINHGIL